MKKLLAHPIAILIALLFATYFALVVLNINSTVTHNGAFDSFDYQDGDTSFGGLIYKPEINDSLPHFEYQHVADSLTQLNEQRLQNNETFLSSWGNSTIGIGKIDDQFLNEQDKEHSRFLILREFELARDVKFFTENKQYKLMYVAWDTLSKKGEPLVRHGTYKSVTIPVRYSEKQKEIYIPISKKTYIIATVIMSIATFILLVLSLFVMFGYPAQFLIRVSKGNAFSEKNINGLRMITILIFLYFLFSILSPFLIRLLFSKYIHPFFKPINIYQLLSDKFIFFFALTIVFAIYQAFKKGYKLQAEADLTV